MLSRLIHQNEELKSMVAAHTAFAQYVPLAIPLLCPLALFTSASHNTFGAFRSSKSNPSNKGGQENMAIQSESTDRILEHKDAFQHIGDGTPKKSVKFTDGKVETSSNVHTRKLSTQTLVEDINLQPKETVAEDRKASQEKFLNVSSLWDISLPEVEWTEEDELVRSLAFGHSRFLLLY
jgi:hypothetical protein